MVGRFYEPDDKICLIFDNEHYEKLRELPAFSRRHRNGSSIESLDSPLMYADMPCSREWAD